MAEVEAIPLVKDQRALLQAAVNEDDAYLRRHGFMSDPDSLWSQMQNAYEKGEIRLAQMHIRASDSGKSRAVDIQCPPLVEVRDALARLESPEQRSEYLIGLRARMDVFEREAEGSSHEAGIIADDYPALVALVRDETKTVQAVVPPAKMTPLPRDAEVQAEREGHRMKTQEALESFKARLHSPFFPGQDPTAFLNRATDPIFELARDLSTTSASDQRTALPSSRISPSRDAAPTQPFHITGSSAPEYAEAFRVAVRRDPSLRTSSFTALVDAANVGHTEDAVRTVARAIEKVTGWKYTPRDVGAFIAVLFVAVGEEVPS